VEGGKERLDVPLSDPTRVATAVLEAAEMVEARTQLVLLPSSPRLPLLLLLQLLLLLPKLLALVVLAPLISRIKVAAGKSVAVDEAGVRMRASNLRLAPAVEGRRAGMGIQSDTSFLGLGRASCVLCQYRIRSNSA